MRKSMFWVSTILAFGLASSQMILAQERNGLDGVWQVNVTVVDCTTGAPVRTVGSLQMFRHDGTFIETANGSNRGISEGMQIAIDDATRDGRPVEYRRLGETPRIVSIAAQKRKAEITPALVGLMERHGGLTQRRGS